jgi:hypothetical protein
MERYSRSRQDTFPEGRVSDDGDPEFPCGIDQTILFVVDKPWGVFDLKGINMSI